MSAKYTVVERKDPQNPDVEGKYYTSNKSDGLIDVREMAEYISQRSGVSVGHVQGIIEDLGEEIESSLLRGETLSLGPIGILSMNVSGEGATTKENYNTSLIKKAYIHLRVRKTLLNKLSEVKYEKVKYATSLPVSNVEEPLP